MRILHVNKFLYRRGGAEAYMFDVAELQRQRGHEVTFWGMQHPENDPTPLSDLGPSHVELEPPPAGARERAKGLARMVWSRSARRGLDEAIGRWRPDVVHHHNIYHQLSPSILRACASHGVRTVMTLHDYKLACPSYQMLAGGEPCRACLDGSTWIEPVRKRCKGGAVGASLALAIESSLHHTFGAYDPVDVFVCPSRFLASTMLEAGIAPERIEVVSHFATEAPAVDAMSRHQRRVVTAGRLAHEKGVDVVIAAMERLPADVELVVAGDGPDRAELERLAAPLGDRITFTGRVDRAEVIRLLSSSSAAIVASRWHENQPMIVLEALGCATPVICTDLGGLPELVAGDRGRVVPHDDAAALASAIGELVDDAALARRLGEAGRAFVREEFAVDRHLDALDRLYRG